MTTRLVADMRETLAVAATLAARGLLSGTDAARLFDQLATDLDDVDAVIDFAVERVTDLMTIGGVRLQPDSLQPIGDQLARLTVIEGGR